MKQKVEELSDDSKNYKYKKVAQEIMGKNRTNELSTPLY